MPYFGIPIRNGLPIGLGSVAGFGISPFDPSSLFAAGEQGVLYDPSDYSTLFTTSAGTTPVSAPGNGADVFVGLMLDKSQGLVLGSELVTNGTFDTNINGWTAGTTGTGTISWSTGSILLTSGTDGIRAVTSITTVAGKSYKLQISRIAGGDAVSTGFRATTSSDGGIAGALQSVTGITEATYTRNLIFTASGTTTYIALLGGASGTTQTAYFDNVSVRELPGNHAFQTNSLKRPELRARYNLLTYSEDLSNAAWTKSAATISANTTIAPDGTLTADTLTDNVTNNFHGAYQISSQGGQVTASIYVKYTNKQYISFLTNNNGTDRYAYFDIVNKTTHNVNAGFTASITDAGNGFVRLSVTSTSAGATAYYYWWNIAASTSVTAYLGDGTGSAVFWGADLRPASQATGLIGPTYQRVAAATVYDTAGFLPYLAFDGLDDSMSTGSIDFTATDKMTVWAGVRKLSAGTLQLVELSASAAANNGAFSMPQDVGTSTWTFGNRGTNSAPATSANNSYVAPITTVNTGIGNIAGDVTTLRVNGIQAATSATDLGSGNYGNYPLFIGARDNTSLYFNGWMYSLTVRGAQSSASEISAMESWVAGKTGVSL